MEKTTIGFLIFPGMLQLDFTGPYGVLASGPATIHTVWKDTAPILSSDRLAFTPSTRMTDCPPLDVIVVPGGGGIISLLHDEAVLAFLRRQAATARYLTSVCTGSLVLGAAGLLKGKHATTHWLSVPFLKEFGAIPTARRVVRDGALFTAAGVTSGIDMALMLAGALWGDATAQAIQLQMEYAPEMPYGAGTPATAPDCIVDAVQGRNAARQAERLAAVRAAAEKLHC